jgi:hypothetical protein
MKRRVIENSCALALLFIALLLCKSVLAEGIYSNPPSEQGAWPYNADLPVCDDPIVLRKIIHNFEVREREYWNSGLFINSFTNVIQTGLRVHGLDYTPRRYCKSIGLFSDGVERDIFYNISPDQSVILSGQVIDWCIQGLDRTHVDGPNCQRVRR